MQPELHKPTITIRPSTPADKDAIYSLIVALAEYERLPPPDEAARKRLFSDAFGPRPRFEIFLAELDGRVVGYAFIFETYSTFLALPTLYLEDLFVLQEHRKHGVGHAIMRFLAQEALKRGCGRLDWNVLDWNENAIRFYQRLGANHLPDWQLYRLDREGMQELAGS
jgi:GNAT superfamily N-acetyltransferase